MKKISIRKVSGLLLIMLLSFCIFSLSSHVQAKESNDVYPLPAPIIEAFPDEDIAEWVAQATGKSDVTDVITQEDLDGVTFLRMEGLPLTGDQLSVFNNEVFPNVTELIIHGGDINVFPVLTAFPNIESMTLKQNNITYFSDASYPKLNSIDLSLNNFGVNYPTFVGMENLENINLYNSNITGISMNAWSDLSHIGEEGGYVDLSENHITEVPNSIVHSIDWGYPVSALGENYTFSPVSIPEGDSFSLYLPIAYQFSHIGEISLMQIVSIDGESGTGSFFSPNDYYVPLPTEDLTVGTHEIVLYMGDRYDSHVDGTYTINITVE
ncbi:internalin N-terminal domain-containing protein [Listeria monocytogenes]|nr:internalin [Listeria monocytogenes]EIP2458432.1 internalin N-terminal domain-containing protein [Listeria monocytogenes]EIP2514789.1 internalin N-terminal domain-containing protein [Listeria monocytogenes]EIR6790402.1 internalin N-terminal domain-containing protein [Listeria monocytogenes]